jgi:hypothetical protein
MKLSDNIIFMGDHGNLMRMQFFPLDHLVDFFAEWFFIGLLRDLGKP